jgi:poly-gamma-glutamate capsule biosynthesis protein CapA/YwtB (metallophosphatase superfamily)
MPNRSMGKDMGVAIKLALAGDTMLGRGVADRLATSSPESLFAPEFAEIAHEADLFVLNLECCISERGTRWAAPGKAFFFRAPPSAAEALAVLGVDCVSLANNHALDFGEEALQDTFDHLARVGVAWAGAGADLDRARAPAVLRAGAFRLGVLSLCDHPEDFAAGPSRPGVAFAGLKRGVPDWVSAAMRSVDADAVLVTPHWGPNMVRSPVPHVRRAARALVGAGATLVAGHSAHVFHGVQGRVLFDLGGFIDDYAVDPVLRNDLGLLWLVTLDESGPLTLEAVPLTLDYCRTRLADGADAAWVEQRLTDACRAMETEVIAEGRRLKMTLNATERTIRSDDHVR